MHLVLLYAVNLWDIVESRPWETEITPRNYMGDPLVLMNVSRRWSQFITSSPQLWSCVLIDTDEEDVMEYLQLFFLLSCNRRLFIVLHGSGDVRDGIVMDLLRVGDRIDTLVYPPNVSRSTLARFQFYLGASHDQLKHVWHKLEVQSDMQPQQDMDPYSLPISIQNLWMPGLFPLSRLATLSHFQSLSFLSIKISLDRVLPPAHKYRLELPELEVLKVQMTHASRDQVDTPINISCGNLKLLDLRYRLELDLENSQEEPVTWMEFDRVDRLEELKIDLSIHIVTEVGSIEPLAELLQMREQKMQELQELLRELELREQQEKRERYLRFMMFIYTRWRKWLNLPNSLTHVQRSSLKVTLSTRIQQEACRLIRNMVEDILVRKLPQLTEMTTSNVLTIYPKHLRKLRLHGFAMSHSFPSIILPSLVSLEIIADSPDHLLVMRCIQVPQLRVLRIQVEDGPGTLHKHDWGDTTNNLLDHISLRIQIPRDKQGNHILIFHLPQTQSLHVFSPYTPLQLYLAEPEPLFYTLNAALGTLSGPSHGQHGQGRTSSAIWNEKLVTEWINPCGIPILAKFKTLVSLQRIVLSQRSYVLSEQSPADTLFKLLEQNIGTCPQLNSITLAQCPSSWPRFLGQLRKRNRDAILLRKTKCIEELILYQPLHAIIIRWLVDAIKARALDVIELPPIREGNAWPMRPFEAEGAFRSCFVCHITGMELGCLEYETRNVNCGRERGEGSKIYAC